jgi:hypothetical protein
MSSYNWNSAISSPKPVDFKVIHLHFIFSRFLKKIFKYLYKEIGKEKERSEDRFQGVRELGWEKNYIFIFTNL